MINLERKPNYQSAKVTKARIINSTLLFIFSFVVITFLQDFFLFIFSTAYGAKPSWYYYGVEMSLGFKTKKYFIPFFAGSFLSVILGGVSLFIYKKRKLFSDFANIIWLWLSVFGISVFLSQLLYLNIDIDEDFGAIYKNMSWGSNFLVFSNLFVVFVAMIVGIIFSVNLIRLANTKKTIGSSRSRRQFVVYYALAPWFIGSLVSYFYYYPQISSYKAIILFVVLFEIIIAWLFASSGALKKAVIIRYASSEKIYAYPIMIIIFVYLLFHAFFIKGISFS